MSQIITITNDFHNTSARVRVTDMRTGRITERQYKRAMRKLCGMSDCTCGGERGSRYQLVEDRGSLGEPYYYIADQREDYQRY